MWQLVAIASRAGKNLKPYQGLKQHIQGAGHYSRSRKKPKTLSGIETRFELGLLLHRSAGKNLKPYQGLKHPKCLSDLKCLYAGKNLKPYQGLKHRHLYQNQWLERRKKPKTLSGIETHKLEANSLVFTLPEKT